MLSYTIINPPKSGMVKELCEVIADSPLLPETEGLTTAAINKKDFHNE